MLRDAKETITILKNSSPIMKTITNNNTNLTYRKVKDYIGI